MSRLCLVLKDLKSVKTSAMEKLPGLLIERENHPCKKVTPNNYRSYIIIVFVIVFALLLGTAGACVAFALQVTTLKSEIASLQMASSSQIRFTHELNSSTSMLFQQLSQETDSS